MKNGNEEIMNIDGIVDMQGGISRVMNNKKLYLSLLGRFKIKEMSDAVISGFNKGDFDETAKAAHALKGSAANLGLVKLVQAAANVEMSAKNALKEEKEEANISKLTGELSEAADITQKAIEQILQSESN
jgi:HPt (histidine-containing phosphotransfer) domain-containing protein